MKTKEEMLEFLTQPRLEWIFECIKGGLSDYENPSFYSAEAKLAHTASARSMLRNCHIVDRANRSDHDKLNIKVCAKGGRVLFRIADEVDFWFKKFDKSLRPRSLPTRQSRAFLGQRLSLWPDDELPPVITNVIAGYLPNAVEQESQIWVTCPQKDRNVWALKLSGARVLDMFTSEETHIGIEDSTTRKVDNNLKRIHIRPGVSRKDGTNHNRE